MICRRYGFTLIELSIVLVIIGLVSAGVLVGRDLIRAAEIRRQITQIEEIDSAVNVFRGKYDCLPGDCRHATRVFIDPGVIDGNNDGCVTNCRGELPGFVNMYDMSDIFSREAPSFWRHLSLSKLVIGDYDGVTTLTDGSIGKTFPPSKLNGKIGLVAYFSPYMDTIDGHGHVYSTAVASQAEGMQTSVYQNTIRPDVAMQLDQKIDDGYPGSGKVNANHSTGFDNMVSDASSFGAPALPLSPGLYCVYIPSGQTRWIYNVTDTAAPCTMRFRATF